MFIVRLLILLFFSSAVISAPCEGHSQSALNRCSSEALNKYNTDMKVLYETQKEHLYEEAAKKRLEDSQLAWEKYRELACRYEVSNNQGSMTGMMTTSCKSKFTLERIQTLKDYVSCRENGCPD